MEKQTLLVTGSSGYIAGWIVKNLLDAGHTVHATVRNPDNEKSVAHLKSIADKAPGTLKLFKADLLSSGSFDEAMKDCSIVIHTASPFLLDPRLDPVEALVKPAVEGTRNVLESATRNGNIQRVVLTSSVASVYGDAIDLKKSGKTTLNESDWNTTSSANHNPYQFSKVAAEREAWVIQKNAGSVFSRKPDRVAAEDGGPQKKQQQWDLVTINPGMVYGPSLTRGSKSGSIGTLLSMGRGQYRMGVPRLSYGVVDVRDVADAHVLAALTPTANGRYLLVNRSYRMLELAGILKKRFGGAYGFPFMEVPKPLAWLFGPLAGPITREFISKNVNHPVLFDNSRSRELGVHYRDFDNTLTEHFEQAIADGLIRKRH